MILFAVSVAACRQPQTISRHAPEAPPAAAGPVNPDARVTAYACVDGQTITAGYPDRETAMVAYKGHAYTLKRAPSGSGARYTGYGLQWSTKGSHAQIAALRPGEETATAAGLDCTAQAESQDGALTRARYPG
jgi:membrane-bound inhibitor of C-type lysozyme